MNRPYRINSILLAIAGIGIAVATLAQGHIAGNTATQATGGKQLGSRNHDLETMLVEEKIVTHVAERKALWTALSVAWPKTFGNSSTSKNFEGKVVVDADLYAENGSVTEICFYRKGQIYTFNMQEKKINPVHMAKVLPVINAITYTKGAPPSGPGFILWGSGHAEAYIGTSSE